MFDHAAARAQVAACIAYSGIAELTWQPSGGGAAVTFPALIADAQPEVTGFDRNTGDEQCVLVTIARSVFVTTLPRQNQIFAATAGGASLRIIEVPKNTFGPSLVYKCVAT